MTPAERPCPVCGTCLAASLQPWLHRCAACGLWASDLVPGKGDAAVELAEWRTEALQPLRTENFRVVLDAVEEIRPLAEARLLEVGCGDGWFLELAGERGARATGIEPDESVAAGPLARALDVRVGPFPEAVREEGRFDAIVFNDVFEHLADPVAVLDRCRALLGDGGVLVFNLPDSRGLLHRVACALARIGIRGPLERLWQVGLESPHLFYFDSANLARLCTGRGFETVHRGQLASFRARGLWSRLKLDGRPAVVRGFAWVALVCALPLVSLGHPDILLQIAVPSERR